MCLYSETHSDLRWCKSSVTKFLESYLLGLYQSIKQSFLSLIFSQVHTIIMPIKL
jgi:hypothetical protein